MQNCGGKAQHSCTCLNPNGPRIKQRSLKDEVALKEDAKKTPATVHAPISKSASMRDKIDQLVNINRFHNLTKLLQVTALITKAAESFKNQVTDKKSTKKERIKLSTTHLKEAENLWIRSVKMLSFSKKIPFGLSKDYSSTPPTYVTKFGLYLDEEIIKCKGRLNNASLPVNTRNPVLMPAKHKFTHLLIKQSHESVKNNGIRGTLTTL